MRFNRLISLTLAIVALVAIPVAAQPGSADFTRYVALGDSLTAGFSNGSLVMSHQMWSYPQVLAWQAGHGRIEQPLISQPGIGPELQLFSLSPLFIGPKSSENGQPINLNLARPYDNLAIPGANARQLLTLSGGNQDPIMFQLVLRGLGPAVDQALALQPTFISLWIGNNDVLGAVTGGSAKLLTSPVGFSGDLRSIVSTLRANAPNAGMVMATIPPVTAIPFANLIPPFVINPATGAPLVGPDGNLVFYIAETEDGGVAALEPGSLVTLNAQFFLSQGFGIPAALAPFLPPLPHIGEPLPSSVVLEADEVEAIATRTAELNAIIRSAASEFGDIPVLDTAEVFTRAAAGFNFGGIRLTTAYLTGGIMSLDGVHPTDIGYTLIANEFIRLINDAYDSEIPYASLVPFFSNNAPVTASLLPPITNAAMFLETPWDFHLKMGTAPEADAVEDDEETPTDEPAEPVRRRGTGRH